MTRDYDTTNSVALSVVDIDATLEEALERMRQDQRSGIVATDGTRYWLLHAADVVIALAVPDSGRTLRDLPRARIPVPVAPQAYESKTMLRHWLDSVASKYVVMDILHHRVRVVTYHEELQLRLESSPVNCYCAVDKKPVPSGANGGTCPDGHAGQVCCI